MDGLFLQAFGSLVLVVTLIFAVLYLLKKFVIRDFSAGKKNITEFKIIGQVMLQPKKYISIIKVVDRILIIGLTDNNINLLSEITDLDAVKSIETSFNAGKSDNKKFLDHLKSNLGLKT